MKANEVFVQLDQRIESIDKIMLAFENAFKSYEQKCKELSKETAPTSTPIPKIGQQQIQQSQQQSQATTQQSQSQPIQIQPTIQQTLQLVRNEF